MPSTLNTTDTLIARQLPAWLANAPQDRMRALCQALHRQEKASRALAQVLDRIPTLDAFAEPLLVSALSQAGLGDPQPRHCWVNIRETSIAPAAAPNLPMPSSVHTSRHSLLAAALHNYHVQETQPSSLRKAALMDSEGRVLPLAFEAFAGLCRDLDLGGRYQRLLGDVLTPSDRPGGRPGQATCDVHRLFEENQGAHLEVAVRMAVLKGELDERSYLHLVSLIAPKGGVSGLSGALIARQLYLLGKRVRGVVVWEMRADPGAPVEGVIAWIPGDPLRPVGQYASWQVLYDALGERLRDAAYREFFSRFISERDRGHFYLMLAERIAAARAMRALELDGRHQEVTSPLPGYLATLQIRQLFDGARVLARPTSDEYLDARRARLKGYVELGLDLLNLAALFVPVLAEALVFVAAAQIVGEVYEGYEDWSIGDRQSALNHLFAVAENVVSGVAISKGSAAVLKSLVRVPFVDSLAPICTDAGQVRLVSPDMSAYSLTDEEARGLQTDHPVLRAHDGVYRVEKDQTEGMWRIQHPHRATAYQPPFEHNGNDGWRHPLERPQQWQGAGNLLRRLGGRWRGLSDSTAEHLLQITGLEQAQVRHLHLENAAVPSRLVDMLDLHEAHEQFPNLDGEALDRYLAQHQNMPSVEEQVLLRDFTGLSVRGAWEIHAQASGVQRERLAEQRVPLALAEQARWSVRDRRLDRACAGLRLPRVANLDTERLAIGLIDHLAPWPETVRVELRQETAAGPVRVALGTEGAGETRLILKRGQTYRTQGGEAQPRTLLSALLHILDDGQAASLGSVGLTEQELCELLAVAASRDREQVARFIGMAPIGAGLRPVRRFGDGRAGYVLSGRAGGGRQAIREGIHQIFPTLSDDQLDSYLQGLGERQAGFWQHYAELQDQLRSLRRVLQAWQSDWHNPLDIWRRRRVANALRRCWRRKSTNAQGENVLVIRGERVGSLPMLPAGVDFAHVRRLVLRDMGLTRIDEDFLRRFSGLVELDLRDNGLVMVPPGLEHLTQLQRLHLAGNEIALDNAGNQRLATLQQLQVLDLGHNPLGRAPMLEGLHRLRHLNLRDAGLGSLPQRIGWRAQVDLRENRIRQIRQDLHGLNQRLQRVALHENPLDDASRALLDQASGIAMPGVRGSNAFRHSDIDDEVRTSWIGTRDGERRIRRRMLWETLRREPESAGLFRFLADFSVTDDFRDNQDYYRGRVWRVLEFCEQHEQLRHRLFQEASGQRTCEDRLLLILNQLELGVLVEQAISDVPATQVERKLVDLGRSLFRLDAVDEIAGRHVQRMRQASEHEVDEIEVRLFYRLKLRRRLGLPLEDDEMHYADHAHVAKSELRDAQRAVLAMENDDALVASLAQRPFWESHVRRRYSQRFEAIAERFQKLQETNEAEREADRIDDALFLERSNTLMHEYDAAESTLIRTLAREAYLRVTS